MRVTAIVILLAVLPSVQVPAQDAPQQSAAPQSEDLAKQLSNPISSLVSVPFQFNWEQGVGPSKATRFILNIQPVMPFTVSKDWNLIVRLIAPYVGQPALVNEGSPAGGFSDITTSFFLSPSKSSKLIWGVGPVIVLPSTSEPTLGSGKWSAGPTIVVLRQTGPWTVGTLWNQVWSFAGDTTRADVNQMFLQPFVSYQATRTVTLILQSEMTANWNAQTRGDTWTVPINFLVSKLSSLGPFPASYQVGAGGFAVHPAAGPTWKVRAAIVLLLPRTRR
jgi:hypothetical protein